MEHNEHDAPGRPQQPEDGFGTGMEREVEPLEQEREPNFARGQSGEDVPGSEHHGRFSEGQEDLPESDPEKHAEGRFSEGQEHEHP
jgi:hypothetical protein